MSSNFSDVNILCPFFKEVKSETVIKCEGLYEGCTCISLVHKNKNEMRKQRDIFCSGKYKNCEVYRMILDSKY